MAVSVVPDQALFTPNSPGISQHKLGNAGPGSLAIKVRCSNNDLYRLRPVYAVLPPGGEIPLEVARAAGPAKQDKLVIQSLACPDGTTEAALPDLFRASANPASVTLNLISASEPSEAPLAAPAKVITNTEFTQFEFTLFSPPPSLPP